MKSVRIFSLTASILLITWISLTISGTPQSDKTSSELPEGFQQLLDRGSLASIDDPVFVSAEEARIPPDAWVLGIVIGGDARAYSLNLLNNHEVVNDDFGDQSIAAVW